MPPRVLVCMPCLLLGGSEVATLALIKALVRATYEVTVCCYYEYDDRMVRRFEQAGAKVECLRLHRAGLFGLWTLFRVLVDRFTQGRPDVVHVQYLAPGMVPILAARWAGIRRVLGTVHAAGGLGYGIKAKLMLRFSASLTDHFFCVARNTERFWFGSVSEVRSPSDRLRTRHSTIYNGVEVETIEKAKSLADRARLCPQVPNESSIVGIVGRLVELKGHETLLRAMVEVLRQKPGIYVLVIGDGPDRTRLQQQAKDLGISENILWIGQVEPEVLPQYYHLMDVLAMPSQWEGFGLTAAEAMAASKPVVGTTVPGLLEVVEEGQTGFLVQPEDDKALADRLLRLLQDPVLAHRLGDNGHGRVRRLFGAETLQRTWIEAYRAFLPKPAWGGTDCSHAVDGVGVAD